ncbi:hypothetical protein G9A89_000650 [Geosiphon pyriformis]|nr:hypothetical protein G9A89_000650 [Geosiphon pyriformis]
MDMVTSNQLGKITNAQFEELQTQITQVILENKIQEILQKGELNKIEYSIEDSLPEGILAIKLRKKLMKLQFRKAMEKIITIESLIVFGNSRHFVQDIFCAVCRAYWEVGSSSRFLPENLHMDVDWLSFSRVWHPDLHMATDFTSRRTADTHTYLMKALHHWLPMAV